MARNHEKDLQDLRLALQTTLHILASPLQPTAPSDGPAPTTAALHQTYLSLIQLLKSHSTSLALALGKAPPTPHAALPSLGEIAEDWKRLEYVVSCVEEGQLKKEWSWARDELKEALTSSIEGFTEMIFEGGTLPRDKYLQRTGIVYGVVDRTVKTLSKTALESIKKRWTIDFEGLQDGEAEAKDMLENDGGDESEEDGEEGNGNDSEDDWAKLLGESGKKPTPAERQLIKSILPQLRLVVSLHRLLSTEHLSSTIPSSALQALVPLSSDLLSASDDLISSLYAPIEQEDIQPLVTSLSEHAQELAKTAEGQMEEGSKGRNYIKLWGVQLDRVEKEILAGLAGESSAEVDAVAQKLEDSIL